VSRRSVNDCVKRFNADGIDGLKEKFTRDEAQSFFLPFLIIRIRSEADMYPNILWDVRYHSNFITAISNPS